MKHLKEFEGLFASDDKFEEGEYVVLTQSIAGYGDTYLVGDIYEILYVDNDDDHHTYKIGKIDIPDFPSKDIYGTWITKKVIRAATLAEIEEYKLKKSANKYNL